MLVQRFIVRSNEDWTFWLKWNEKCFPRIQCAELITQITLSLQSNTNEDQSCVGAHLVLLNCVGTLYIKLMELWRKKIICRLSKVTWRKMHDNWVCGAVGPSNTIEILKYSEDCDWMALRIQNICIGMPISVTRYQSNIEPLELFQNSSGPKATKEFG